MANYNKKLSIITICYNEPNLEKTCESIVNQTWQDFEWIVVDGGSNEETQKIWNKYKYRIDKFISEPDNGRYAAMNKGIRLSQGEYLNFLNAGDCYFYNNVLKDIFESNTYIEDVLYGDELFTDYSKKLSQIFHMPYNINKKFLFYSTIRHQSSFIKRELFDKFGLYNETYNVVSDYEKWFIFLENNANFKYIPYTIACFNTEGISANNKTRDIALSERDCIIKKYCSSEEIETFINNEKNSFLEEIFSIKNSNYETHKIITILGIKIKFKIKNKVETLAAAERERERESNPST